MISVFSPGHAVVAAAIVFALVVIVLIVVRRSRIR